ncbi:AprI/Inh family metalloprotease inhibitor [Brevundimonas sp.]|uniref:AprI/Inh family metalloprotease inhibitor n=1 Tax=Brevundimonas sp. TaxID=1871086 RepID=UPI002D73B7F0|nr:AprI/Inh family metalloprotease inhibitor [Brevundimonas sp.]HYC68019.1 AprI/Inh family metalloprotease inhibitor [Brevundimonas sp.]
MSRSIAVFAAAAAVVAAASPGLAQSIERSTTRSETTTTQDGDTTRSVTRSTTVGGSISVDADAAIGALVGALEDRADPESRALRRRAERIRAEDAFGVWVADDGGRDVGDCRLTFRDRAFLGVRGVGAEGCPARLARISNWRVENGEALLFRGAGDQDPMRLMMVEGRLIGDGLTLAREGDAGPGPTAGDLDRRDDRGGWSARLSAEDYSGAWKHIETTNTGHRRECTLRLTTNPSFGALGASASGCFGDLMFVSTWRLEDGRVALYKAGGATVAILRGGPSRLSGRTEEGAEVVLYR